MCFYDCVTSRKRKMSGFGHRVYKNYDPRAKVIKKLAEEVFSIVGRDPLIEVSLFKVKGKFLHTMVLMVRLVYRLAQIDTHPFQKSSQIMLCLTMRPSHSTQSEML